MTLAEIAELREFISGELRKVHGRFGQVDTRLDQVHAEVPNMRGTSEENSLFRCLPPPNQQHNPALVLRQDFRYVETT